MLKESVLDKVEASVQERIGIFLTYKSKILKLNNSPLLDIKDKVPYLMQRQIDLETRFTDAKANMDKAKVSGGYIQQISAYSEFVVVLKDINNHMDEVNDLLAKSNMADEIPADNSLLSTKDWIIIGLIGYILFRIFVR